MQHSFENGGGKLYRSQLGVLDRELSNSFVKVRSALSSSESTRWSMCVFMHHSWGRDRGGREGWSEGGRREGREEGEEGKGGGRERKGREEGGIA